MVNVVVTSIKYSEGRLQNNKKLNIQQNNKKINRFVNI